MSLFVKASISLSPKERISLVKFFSFTRIKNNLIYYSSRQELKITLRGLAQIKNLNPKRILVINLHTGGEIKAIQKKYKKANITLIDQDLIAYNFLVDSNYLKKIETKIYTIPSLESITNQKFDLIVYSPKKQIAENELCEQVQKINTLLTRDGFLITTVGTPKSQKKLLNTYVSPREVKGFLRSKISLFQRFGRGERTDPLPSYFQTFLTCKEYLEREMVKEKKLEILTQNNDVGARWKVFPFLHTETYVTDEEPKIIEKYPYMRVIQWQPLSITPTPRKGWVRFFSNLLMTQHGVTPLEPDYYKTWSEQAQRKRAQYLKQQEYTIVPLTYNEYSTQYYDSKQPATLKSLLIKQTKDKITAHGDLMQLWGVKDSKGKIHAGLAVLDIPEVGCSLHVSAFTLTKYAPPYAGAALIDYWYQHSIKQGYKFLDFAIVRSKYDPWAWEGYSIFKRQFVKDLILFKKPLLTFRWPTR